MAMLTGKRLLLTGVISPRSLAFGVAELALQEGAEIVLTSVGPVMKHTERAARRLPVEVPIIEMDVTQPDQLVAARDFLAGHWGGVDGALHAIGYAPESCLGGGFLDAGWDDVATALHISAYSLKALADVVRPLMPDGGSIVGLDFDATQAWPQYDWMGVAKSALESTSRYLARYLGAEQIRVNLVAAGPIKTIAARSIPGFSQFEETWSQRAPLGWDVGDDSAVAKACVCLLSDWFPATTGEIVHVDGGFHACGA